MFLACGLSMSHWNGKSNFSLLAKIGVEFVLAKASEGTQYQDDTYRMNHSEFKARRVGVGAYHYWNSASAAAQAENFLRAVKDNLPDVWMIDVEEHYKNPREEYQRIRSFILEVYNELGMWPIWYSNQGYMAQFAKVGIEELAPLPFCVAEYNFRLPKFVYPWFMWTLYQMWGTQVIPGLNGGCEFIGSRKTWPSLVQYCKRPKLLGG